MSIENPVIKKALLSTALRTDSGAIDGITNVSTADVSGLIAGLVWQYQVDGNGPWLTGTGSSFNLSNGAHNYVVRQADKTGLVTLSAPVGYTLDTIALVPKMKLVNDTGATGSDGITRIAAVSVSDVEYSASWQYQVDGKGEWLTGGGNSFNAVEGTHSYAVRQTDKAGNVSAESAASTITLDTVALAPSLSLQSDSGAADCITNVAKVNVGGLEGGVGLWLYRTDGAVWQLGSGASFNLVNGKHSYEIQQYDVAGNVSPVSASLVYTLDTAAPAVPSFALVVDSGSSATDHITIKGALKVEGLEAGASWQYQVDDDVWYNGGGGSGFNLLVGTHSYRIQQTDVAGNQSPLSSAVSYTLDNRRPSAPELRLEWDGGVGGDDITNVETVIVGGLEQDARWQYQIDGGEWQTGGGGGFDLMAGTHSYAVKQTDVAGNDSLVRPHVSYTLDTEAPVEPRFWLQSDLMSPGDNITTQSNVRIGGLEDGGRWQYQVDGGSWLDGYGTSFDLIDGQHRYTVRQIDVAGNESQTVTSQTYSLVANPYTNGSHFVIMPESVVDLDAGKVSFEGAGDGSDNFDMISLFGADTVLDLVKLAALGVHPNSFECVALGWGGDGQSLTLGMNEVLDMSEANVLHSGNGWSGLAATETRHQVAVSAFGGGVVNLSAASGVWTDTGATSTSNDGHTYEIWTAGGELGAQLLIDQLLTVHPNV